MFERFFSSFKMDPPATIPRPWSTDGTDPIAFSELMTRAAGCSFDGGLYRLHDLASSAQADALVRDAFPELTGRIRCFGYDWLGRQFGLDAARLEGGERLVAMAEPGTGELLQIPANFAAFHEDELVSYGEAALARAGFEDWSRANPGVVPLAATDCVGYSVPLFLGGSDTPDNFEVIDIDVYWTICGQLRQGTRTMPAGTTIRELTIR